MGGRPSALKIPVSAVQLRPWAPPDQAFRGVRPAPRRCRLPGLRPQRSRRHPVPTARLASTGTPVRVTTDPNASANPSIAWSGSAWGIVWEEERDGNRELYFVVVAADGTVGAPVRITVDQGVSTNPSLVHDGTAWTVVWRDDRDDNDEIYAARFADDGTRLADDSRLTDTTGRSWNPDLVFDGTGYAVAWEEETDPTGARVYYFQTNFLRFSCP